MKTLFLRYSPAILFLILSCNSSGILSKRSAHESYSNKLESAGLLTDALGKAWARAAEMALDSPVTITMPFKEIGYFAAEKPSSAGYLFPVSRGTKIVIFNRATAAAGARLFTDIWLVNDQKRREISSSDKLSDTFVVAATRDGNILIRLQPELLVSMEYEITINFEPALAFPVDSSGKPAFISFWGAGRDAGARKHEGVDIRANFRTPALAAADGIARIADNRLGGKAVFISDMSNGISLYYAHLDSQMVASGKFVRTGDTVGLIGNTGNAKGTVPHLHFGIYTQSGAIDPILFIKPNRQKPPPVSAPIAGYRWARLNTDFTASMAQMGNSKIKLSKNTPLLITGAMDDSYRTVLPAGSIAYIPKKNIALDAFRSEKAGHAIVLTESPRPQAIRKSLIGRGDEMQIIGFYNGFALIMAGGIYGWAKVPDMGL